MDQRQRRTFESHRQAFEDDLAELLRIASVSADSRQRGEVAAGGRVGGRRSSSSLGWRRS